MQKIDGSPSPAAPAEPRPLAHAPTPSLVRILDLSRAIYQRSSSPYPSSSLSLSLPCKNGRGGSESDAKAQTSEKQISEFRYKPRGKKGSGCLLNNRVST